MDVNSIKHVFFIKVSFITCIKIEPMKFPLDHFEAELQMQVKKSHVKITYYRFKFLSVFSKIMNTGHSDFNMARLRVQYLKKKKKATHY